MGYNFNGIILNDVSQSNRSLWEKRNKEQLEKEGYFKRDDEWRSAYFANTLFKKNYSGRDDYKQMINEMSFDERVSMLERHVSSEDLNYVSPNKKKEEPKTKSAFDRAIDWLNRHAPMQGGTAYSPGMPGNIAHETVGADPIFKEDLLERTQPGYLQKVKDSRAELEADAGQLALQIKNERRQNKEDKDAVQNLKKEIYADGGFGANFRDKIHFTDEDWENLSAEYEANKRLKGEKVAKYELGSAIADEVNENLGAAGVAGRTGMKFLNNIVGTTILLGGTIVGTAEALGALPYKAIFGDNPGDGLNVFEEAFSLLYDNAIANYGADLMSTGAYSRSQQKFLREHGLDKYAVAGKAGYAADFIGSMGFTTATMGLGMAESAITSAIFKAAAGRVVAGKTGQALLATRAALSTLSKAEKAATMVNAAMLGAAEGAQNALETKNEIIVNGLEQVHSAQYDAVQSYVSTAIKDGTFVPIGEDDAGNTIYTHAKLGGKWDTNAMFDYMLEQHGEELSERTSDLEKQVYAAAERGALTDYAINSFINGYMNTTLQSLQMGDRASKILRNTHILGSMGSSGRLAFREVGDEVTAVANRVGTGSMIWHVSKEIFGEGLEEYLQDISSNVGKSAAASNIEHYIDAKYSGQDVKTGERFLSDLLSAIEGGAEGATSRDAWVSMGMGALSTALGNPTIDIQRAYTGKVVKDKNGKTHHERVWFGKGLNAEGKKESTLEMLGRMLPIGWRSGAYAGYKDFKSEAREKRDEADRFNLWFQDPENRKKWESLKGTEEYVQRLSEAKERNDLFHYKNDLLGSAIVDAYWLKQMKGTAYYDKIMQRFNDLETLADDDPKMQEYIDEVAKNSTNTIGDDAGSEEDARAEIADRIRKNASKMKSILADVDKYEEKIQSLFGHIDQEGMQALVYNQMADADWDKRTKEIEERVEATKEEKGERITREDRVQLSAEQAEVIGAFGSIAEAKKAVPKLEKQIATIDANIQNLKSIKHRSSRQEAQLENLKKERGAKETAKNKLQETLQTFTKTVTNSDGVENTVEMTDDDVVLSERDIMRMDHKHRKNFLLRGLGNRYNAVHGEVGVDHKSPYGAAQQAVIEGMANHYGDQWLQDVIDLGRIQEQKENGMETFIKYATDKQSLYSYIDRQKQKAAMEVRKAQYSYLNDIQDYNDFRNSYEKAIKNATTIEDFVAITQAVANNGHMETLKKQKADSDRLLNQVDLLSKNDEMDSNDMELAEIISDFLTRNNIDITDDSAIMSALGAMEENGNSAITNYVAQYNQGKDHTVHIDNLEKVLGKIKEAAKVIKNNNEARDALAAKPTPSTGSGVSRNSVIQEGAQQSEQTAAQEGNQQDSSTEEAVDIQEVEDDEQDSLEEEESQNGEDSSSKEMQDEVLLAERKKALMDVMRKKMLNSGGLLAKITKTRNLLLEQYDGLVKDLDIENMTEEEIVDWFNSKLKDTTIDNALKSRISEVLNDIKPDSYLRGIAEKNIKKQEKERSAESYYDEKITGVEYIDPLTAFPKDHPLHSLFRAAGTERFISDGEAVKTKRTTTTTVERKGKDGNTTTEEVTKTREYRVEYLYDPAIAKQVEEEMKAAGKSYTIDDAPILAVYPLSEELHNKYGGIAVKVGNATHWYMPVGLVPTANSAARGAELAQAIRNTLSNTTTQHLLTKDNKRLRSIPRMTSPRLQSASNSSAARDVLQDANDVAYRVLEEKRREAEANNIEYTEEQEKKDFKKAAAARRAFLHKLFDRTRRFLTKTKDGSDYYYLVYELPSGVGNHKTVHRYHEKPMATVTNKDGKTIAEVAAEGTLGEHFNAYTSDFIEHLSNFISNHLKTGSLLGINNDGLDLLLKRDLYTKGQAYSIKEDTEGDGFALYLGDTRLGAISDANGLAINGDEIISNLLWTGTGVRPGLHFQVDYASIDKADSFKKFERAVEAGVLKNGIQDPNWERPNKVMWGEIPKDLGYKPKEQARTNTGGNQGVVNSNATKVFDVNGQEIDPEMGQPTSGETGKNPVKNLFKSAINIVNKILKDSTHIKLEPDEQHYKHDTSSTLFERVTTIIRDIEDKFNELWKTPSTNIGTTVDNFTRRFFEFAESLEETLAREKRDLTLEDILQEFKECTDSGHSYIQDSTGKVYYNFSYNQMKNFAQQLLQLHKYFKDKHLKIYANGITVSGNVIVDGKVVNVAGTLDILAVDPDGNFHIFDMKTHRWDYDSPGFTDADLTKLEEHKRQWSRQLGLYKYLLEQQYLKGTHHVVKECSIIPISVHYTEPSNINVYDVSDAENNRLTINDHPFFAQSLSLDLNGLPDNNGMATFAPISIYNDDFFAFQASNESTYDKKTLDNVESEGSGRAATQEEKNVLKPRSIMDGAEGMQGETPVDGRFEHVPQGQNTQMSIDSISKAEFDKFKKEQEAKYGRKLSRKELRIEWNKQIQEVQKKQDDCAS